MKTIIYYFTGTGNSLAAARKVAESIGDCDLISIASLRNTTGEIVPPAERVGIVCPVYDCGVPAIVAEFSKRLDAGRVGYLFAVVTMGGMGVSALHQIDGIFRERRGRGLEGAFAVTMPGNFPPLGRPPAGKKLDKILASSEKQLDEISKAVDSAIETPPSLAPISTLVKALTYGPFTKNVHEAGKSFSVSDECNSCGTCEKVCPVGNITLADGKPAWGHNCELCCACLHFCPAEAIQIHVMRGTEGRGRYRHPEVKVSDMETQAGN